MGIINGVYTAMVTPFDKNFKVDYKKLAILIERQIEAKVAGIVLNSTTGESLTLSESEKEKIIKFVLKINKGRLKIIVGVGNSSTQKTLSEICFPFLVTTSLMKVDCYCMLKIVQRHQNTQ